MKIDSIQADILAANKVNVSKGEWGVRGPGAEVQRAPRLRLASPPSSIIHQWHLLQQTELLPWPS